MALNSSTVSSGDLATAQQYNDLRSDIVSTSSGHVHDGTLGVGSSQFILNVAGVPLLLQNTTDAASNEALRIAGGNRGTAADNDEVTIDGYLDNCGETQTFFGSITLKALDNGPSCTYDSRWEFQQYTAGTLREVVVPAVTADDTLAVLGLAQTFSAAKTFSGGLTVSGTIDYDGTCVDFLSSGDIDLVSSRDAAAAIYIAQSTGTSGTVKIHADTGTSVTEGAESINILSDVGGVGIRSTANLANAINLTVDGGTTSSMTLFNDQGTSVTEGAASIALVSDAGGVELRSTANLVNAINITNDGGTTGTISIFNDLGSSVTEGAESISLLSDAGGVGIRSTANLVNAVNITADGGTTSTIQIFNDQGTTATEGAASIQLLSDVGGIGIKSGLNAAGAIRLTADAGTSETIILHADQGNGVGSICLTSDAGGITLNPATFVTVGGNCTNAGEIRILEDTNHGALYVALKAPNVTGSYTITLPTAVAGTCGFVLTSTTAGVTSWAAAGGPTEATKTNMEDEDTGTIYVPPDLVKNSPGVAKVWVQWQQTDVGGHGFPTGGSYNYNSATDGSAVGDTNHVFITSFSSGGIQAYVFGSGRLSGGPGVINIEDCSDAAGTVTTLSKRASDDTAVDGNSNMMAIFGLQ
jgi:hypothetical protein